MSSSSVTVLHVDDDVDFAGLTREFLQLEDDRFDVQTAHSAAEALEEIERSPPDCVVSDYDMPGQNGIEFLRAVRDEHPNLPFILFTGKGSEEVASDAIAAGVTGYLRKKSGSERYQLLANRIRNAVERRRASDELAETKFRYRSLRTELIELSIDLLQSEDADVDDRIETALGRIGNRAEVDRSYVFQIDRDADAVSNTHEWCADGVEPQIESLQEIPLDDIAWWMDQLEALEPITIPDVSELPAAADTERTLLEAQEIESLVVAPMVDCDELIGFIGFDCLNTHEAVDEELVDLLHITGRLITSALRQESRRQELREYETVVKSLGDAVYVLDERGRFTYVNDAFVKLVGYDRERILGSDPSLVKDEETLKRAERQLGGLLSSEGPDSVTFKTTIHPRDGDPVVCEDHMGVLPYDGPCFEGSVGTLRDVTEREAQTAEVFELKQQYQTLAENLPNGAVFLFDDELRYIRARGTELEAVGLSPADLEGSTPYDVFPPGIADELIRYYEAALDGESHTFTQTLGEDTYRNRTVPVEDSDGSIRYGMALTQNVTEEAIRRETLEAQNERLEEFTRVLSHDLRNPIQVAGGRVELARAECDSDHLDGAAAAIDRAGSLIDDLMMIARGGDAVSETEAISLSGLAESCWDVVPTADATLTVHEVPSIYANRGRLRQLLENLFSNAVEHGGANVAVSVGALDDGFYVADDGTGIPEEERNDVFKLGYSTGDDGSGFGLGIVRQIADAHGWEIRVTESDEGGARFEVTGVERAD